MCSLPEVIDSLVIAEMKEQHLHHSGFICITLREILPSMPSSSRVAFLCHETTLIHRQNIDAGYCRAWAADLRHPSLHNTGSDRHYLCISINHWITPQPMNGTPDQPAYDFPADCIAYACPHTGEGTWVRRGVATKASTYLQTGNKAQLVQIVSSQRITMCSKIDGVW